MRDSWREQVQILVPVSSIAARVQDQPPPDTRVTAAACRCSDGNKSPGRSRSNFEVGSNANAVSALAGPRLRVRRRSLISTVWLDGLGPRAL